MLSGFAEGEIGGLSEEGVDGWGQGSGGADGKEHLGALVRELEVARSEVSQERSGQARQFSGGVVDSNECQ
jgi:hypothetical protein